MKYVSTRTTAPEAGLSQALEQGIAPDGGLYVPDRFPSLAVSDFGQRDGIVDTAEVLLASFFQGDPLEGELLEICREAFNFPVPLRTLPEETAVLELFHGPTAAFKDFGARFLAAAMARLPRRDPRTLTVLVATSGDTGGAVAAAFHERPGVEVVVLYPKGMVSERQEKQLTAWGGNVRALRVRGDFDACQRLVKEAFADPELREARRLTSANSINLGRLLPQMAYYADASLRYLREHGVAPGFIVPSGNLGNATAGLWAQRVGLPIREVALATNANLTITRFLASGEWEPRPTVQTLASAMDVGNPSNIERLTHLFRGWAGVRRRLRAIAVSDDEIRAEIRRGPDRWGQVWDPHTAAAAAARDQFGGSHWILVGTAHAAKFESVVEPLVGREVEIPPALARLLERPSDFTEIDPTLDELRRAVA